MLFRSVMGAGVLLMVRQAAVLFNQEQNPAWEQSSSQPDTPREKPEALLANPSPNRQVLHKDHLAVSIRIIPGQKHPVGFYTAELRRLQVGNDNDLLSDQLLGLVPGMDGGNDLPPTHAVVQLQAEQLLGLGHRLAFDNLANP